MFRRKQRPLIVETGPGPEGSRLTMNIRRPQGCGVEKGGVGKYCYVQSTDNVSHLVFNEVFDV